MYTSSLYAWGTRALRVLGSFDNSTARSSLVAHISVLGAGEIKDEDMWESSVNTVVENLHCKVSLVPFFNLQNYGRENTWPSISQIHETTSQLCAGSQNHEEKIMESLETKK